MSVSCKIFLLCGVTGLLLISRDCLHFSGQNSSLSTIIFFFLKRNFKIRQDTAELPNLHAYQSELQSTKLYFEITFSWLCTKTGYLWNLFFHISPLPLQQDCSQYFRQSFHII